MSVCVEVRASPTVLADDKHRQLDWMARKCLLGWLG
jgi:hypothetical protein